MAVHPAKNLAAAARGSFLAIAALAVLLGSDPAGAADWKIDPSKSSLGFKGRMGSASFEGHFGHWEGRISFDPAHPDLGRAHVTIDMSSAQTGDQQRDAALRQSPWFDAKTYPDAFFEAQSFRATGGHAYDAIGTLTIRNITKRVVMPVTIDVSGARLHATGHLDLVRTDYGVGQATSDQWVALDVTVLFDVTAERSD